MNYKDYYKIMAVDKTASQDEIKTSYRKLARKFHPDVSKEKDAETRFKDINEAYEVLRDKEKRAAYDQLGSNWKAGQSGFTPPPSWQDQYQQGNGNFNAGAGGQGDFSDFFESLFGGGFGGGQHAARGRRSMQGQDSNAKILIDLQDAYTGATRNFTLQDQVVDQQGRTQTKDRTLKVSIPKGIKPGQKIRLKKQGQAGVGGAPNGDLYLEVGFNPDSLYTIEGADITTELSISPWQAALGEKVKVPTPTGHIDLSLPKLISSGSKMRLKGRGLPCKVAGDFFVKLKIVFPKSLSTEEEALYQSLKALATNSDKNIEDEA
ncbi:DnaJ C-terminal domain-containing protein [Cognaticolwellia beringensis]|uniref:Cytochrome C biogenesis protein n=1 Tax=Cognaticolwellia beringensis TaxID=1967665 RepID=A0A222G569_9GAMM|nr:DnaJ C-terminal domain-containing protein [Cognaticolwellia beringensis]ASP47058.1 cytochrome C biogenesis protein [Cognaticolwellia beringensis]